MYALNGTNWLLNWPASPRLAFDLIKPCPFTKNIAWECKNTITAKNGPWRVGKRSSCSRGERAVAAAAARDGATSFCNAVGLPAGVSAAGGGRGRRPLKPVVASQLSFNNVPASVLEDGACIPIAALRRTRLAKLGSADGHDDERAVYTASRPRSSAVCCAFVSRSRIDLIKKFLMVQSIISTSCNTRRCSGTGRAGADRPAPPGSGLGWSRTASEAGSLGQYPYPDRSRCHHKQPLNIGP